MKKYLFLITAAVIFFTACNDPIFYDISLEEKILEPMIIGSPTNFVELGNKMYVASGRYIYEYGADGWVSKGIGGSSFIYSLAATNNQIYALCEESGKRILNFSSDGINWSPVASSRYNIQKIYSANGKLFAGAGSTGSYSILSLNGTTFSEIQDTGNYLLNGAASDGTNYYLSAKIGEDSSNESGIIYKVDNTMNVTTERVRDEFMGIINTASNQVFAISRDGNLYHVNGTVPDNIVASFGGQHLATGALAVWTDGTNYLLLAGRQDNQKPNGYAYGYLELNITSNISGVFHEPGGGTPTTLMPGFDDNGPYSKSLGKRAVNHLYQYQAPGGTRTLFASLAVDGVWSYRDRGGKWQWNAEERR